MEAKTTGISPVQPFRKPWYLIAVFLFVVIGIASAGYLYYKTERKHVEEDVRHELSAVADLKVAQLTAWRNARLRRAMAIRENPFIASHARQWFRTGTPALRQEILAWMGFVHRYEEYRSVFLLDEHGTVRLSVASTEEEIKADDHRLALEAARTGKVIFSDLQQCLTAKDIHLDIFVPLMVPERPDTLSVGVLLLRVDARQTLYPFVQTWPSPRLSAETLLIRREGDSVVFLNELRHRKDTALKLRYPLAEKRLVASQAVRSGGKGVTEGVDYRGIPVLGAFRPVPDSPWFLVAKIDKAEVYAPIRQRTWIVVILTGLFVMAAGVAVIFYWRQKNMQFSLREYQARLERQALEQRYEYLTRYANDLILLVDSDQRIIEVNERAVASYEYTRNELLQMKLIDLESVETRSDFHLRMRDLEEQKGLIFETLHKRKNGAVFPVEISARVIQTDGERFYQTIIRDITERKQAAAALDRLRRRTELILLSAGDGIFGLDTTGRHTFVNPAAARMIGYEVEELIGKSSHDVCHHTKADGSPYPEEECPIYAAYKDGAVHHVTEELFWRRDGSNFCVEYTSTPIVEEGSLVGAVVTFKDITDRKRIEEEINNLNDDLKRNVMQLETANKELEAFTYSVSHDLRAPLRAIDGFSRVVLADYGEQLDEEGRRFLNIIRTNTQIMSQLIDDLLALSRFGRQKIAVSDIDMEALVKAVFEELKPGVSERKIDFIVKPLPRAMGDRVLLRQVWANLLSNALKFTTPREAAVIEVEGRREKDEHVYSVRDNGVGFDMRYADKLFGVFQRLHGMDEFEGTGVGLAIVQRIIYRHGGRVWGEGKVDEGATFYFALPAGSSE